MNKNPAVVGLIRTQLEALGWTDEDPVPPNLPQLLQTIKQSAVNDLRSKYENASGDEQANLLQQLQKLEGDSFFRVEHLPPEFVLAAQQQLFSAIEDAKREIEEANRVAELEAKLPQQIQGEERAKILERLSQPQEPEAPVEDAATVLEVAAAPPPEYCPCCAWNLSTKYEVEVTAADKEQYVAAVLGNSRFHKTYPLFGSRGSVTFRTLLTTEADAIRFYLFEQSALGKITNDAMYYALWTSSRAMLSLETVYYDGKPSVYSSTYDGFATARGNIAEAAGLEEYLKSINELVSQETLRTLIFDQFNKFELLVEQLKLRANDPNFYSGI